MLKDHDFIRTYSGVVIHAEYHVPSILSPEFLLANEIVPGNWEHGESMIGMYHGRVIYQNNVSISLDATELQIEDNRNMSPDVRSVAFDIADRYLAAVQLVNYQRAAVTMGYDAPMQDSGLFLTERFLRSAFHTGARAYVRMDPRFRFSVGEWDVNMWMSAGLLVQATGQTVETLRINIDGTTKPSVQGIESTRVAINQWTQIQPVIETVAIDLIWGDDSNDS